jgi:predicted acyltransferase
MILVSTPGTWDAVYRPLEHAEWHGWTPTDLVFPFLLFAMGAAVPFALERRRGSPRRVRRHIIRRAVLLFALGLLLNAVEAPPPLAWSTFRIPGVLQRIAIVYAVVAWLTERTSTRTQVIAAVGALLGYWAALMLIPVPGAGAGVLTESDNLAASVDRLVFGRHLAHPDWDPEGLLSTIPAVATALAGVFAGDWIKKTRRPHTTVDVWGAGLLLTGVGLVWDRVFPINKNLWTSSFALFSAGLAAQLLAVCHWLIDEKGWRKWSLPLVAFGRNALAAYFLSVALDSVLTRWSVPQNSSLKDAIFSLAFSSWAESCCGLQFASLMYALAYVALWAIVVSEMSRRRIFIAI